MKKNNKAHGSSVNNHILQDLRGKLVKHQLINYALIEHFKLPPEEVERITREFVQKQYAEGHIGKIGNT